jgi:cytidylate kinase
MENILQNYLSNLNPDNLHLDNDLGPVVTISRECGCSANRIAIKLSKILTGYSYQSASKKDVEWRWLNKEVIEKAAVELEMNPGKVRSVFLGEARMSIHEVSNAFSTEKVYDADNQKVIDTVKTVVAEIAREGNCVIVGRAASAVAKDIPKKLSIKLQAPFEWRIKQIMQVSNMTYTDARDYVLEIDQERSLFVEHIAGRKLISTDFDVVFNCATMSDDLIVDAIINILKNKKIIVAL